MVITSDWLDVQKIADSGQCFRMKSIGGGWYRTVSGTNYLELRQVSASEVEFNCSQSDMNFWRFYFDLDTDLYNKFYDLVQKYNGSGSDYIKKAVEYSKGIRILNQDVWETLVSFIISQRNSIPRISSMVEKLCSTLGNKMTDSTTGKEYFTFPNIDKILENKKVIYNIGLGYRDEYVISAAEFCKMTGLGYFDKKNGAAKAEAIKGVGHKVSSCFALFALHDMESFPVDVWVQRILDNRLNNDSEFMGYFKEYLGLLQQCMFYYERSLSKQ